MTNYHPEEHELLEFSAGNSGWAESIAIGVHLHFCPACAAKVADLNQVGAQYIEKVNAVPMNDGAKAAILARIKDKTTATSVRTVDTPTVFDKGTRVPSVVSKLIAQTEKLKWQKVSKYLQACHLKTGQQKYEVSLHRIKKGGSTVQHDHRGKEIVIVLEGSFSDEKGAYYPGDYLVNQPGDIHSPAATKDRDCICLSLVAAPVKLTGPLGWFVNPFLRHSPA